MTNLNYTVAVVGDEKVVAFAPPGGTPVPLMTATSFSHPNSIDEIIRRLGEGDENVVELFSPEVAVRQRFEGTLSADVKVADGQVFFRGESVDNAITDQILRFLEEDQDFKPLVRFMEKLAANPQEHAREQSYRWLQTCKFTITDEGDILAYKGVQSNYNSKHAGKGIVNGEAVGNVNNTPGNVCEYARDEVVHNPGVACAEGLHAGTYSYASGFASGNGDKVVEVLVNPADIVSVPTDSRDQKMRVCRYTVLKDCDGERSSALAKDVSTSVKVDLSALPRDDEELEYEGYGSLVDYAVWSEGTLLVEMYSGNQYRYNDRDASLFHGLEDADSDGAYFNSVLKGNEVG